MTADRVRKELAGVSPEESARAPFGEGIYTAEWNDRTYDARLERALDIPPADITIARNTLFPGLAES